MSSTTYSKLLLICIVITASISLLRVCSAEIEPKFDDDDVSPPPVAVAKLDEPAINAAPNDAIGNSINNPIDGEPKKADEATKRPKSISDIGFVHAFVASISVILVSELGDKTFFIAAIMAMRHPRLTVFTGAIAALALMTVLSAVFGMAATIIPRVYTYYISTALFAIFGLKMLKEGYSMSPNDSQEELEEVQSDIRKREDELQREVTSSTVQDPETGVIRKANKRSAAYVASRIFLQAFTMTFLAEWGDRSQLTTIILGAREDVYGVIVGGVLGHSLCTGLAVIGGRMIAQKISVRTVTIVGGVVFLLFAVSALFFDPSESE